MNTTLLIARLLLVGVFGIAGLAKLADLPGSKRAIREFGLPALITPALGLLLPIVELVVAGLLLSRVATFWGAVGALILLVAFIIGIGANLALGRHPECHCFGQLHSSPAGWKTLLRNSVLAAVAAFIFWQAQEGNHGPSIVHWFLALTLIEQFELLSVVLICSLLVFESWMLFHLLPQQGRLLSRVEAIEKRLDMRPPSPPMGLPVGTLAPSFEAFDLQGKKHTLTEFLQADLPLLLIFSDPGCTPCNEMMPEVARWQREYKQRLTAVVVSRGKVEANQEKAKNYQLQMVLLQKNFEVGKLYKANYTPGAVLIQPDGKIGSLIAQGAEEIRDLVQQIIAVREKESNTNQKKRVKLTIGTLAPEFSLPDLTGRMVSLNNFRGTYTIILFWNPRCGFCKHMLEDLKSWETRASQGDPRLLIVSTGTVEANKEQGLLSPVVLDQSFVVGHMFGATGTPMSILVDAEGRVVSEVATGAAEFFKLADAMSGPATEVKV